MIAALNQIAKTILDQAEPTCINWPEELQNPFFKSNACLINNYLNNNESPKFLAIQTPGNQAQNVGALAAVICSILKSPFHGSNWIPEKGQQLYDNKEKRFVEIVRVSGNGDSREFHLKTKSGSLAGSPNIKLLRKRYNPVNQDNNRIRWNNEPIEKFWSLVYPSFKIEDGILSPPLVIGNLNRTLDDCKIRSLFPILELGNQGTTIPFPPVVIHAANVPKAREYLRANKDENRMIILIGRAATIQGINAVRKWIAQGKAKGAILISQKWLDRKELGELDQEIVRWIWGPKLAPIVAGYQSSNLPIVEINDERSHELVLNLENIVEDFYTKYQIKIDLQPFLREHFGSIIPERCPAEIKAEIVDELEKIWINELDKIKEEAFQAGYSSPDFEMLEHTKNQLIEFIDLSKDKFERLNHDDFQEKFVAIIPERLKAALVSQDRLSYWSSIHALTLQEFLESEITNRKPFLFSIFGFGKKRGPIRLLLALMQKNTAVKLMAYKWEKEQYLKYFKSLNDWEFFSLRKSQESGLIPFEIPEIQDTESKEDFVYNKDSEIEGETWESELLDRLTEGGWKVRSRAYSNLDDEDDPWISYCTVEFDAHIVKVIPANKTFPVKRGDTWNLLKTYELEPEDRILEYENLEGLSTRTLVEKYWPSDRFFQWLKECRNSWKGGLSDFFERKLGGRNIGDLKNYLIANQLSRTESTLRAWLTFDSEIFFPQSSEDLRILQKAGVRFRSKQLDEIIYASQAFDSYLIQFGRELAAELRKYRMEGDRGPKLCNLDDSKVEWIERNMLIERIIVRIEKDEVDE